MRHARLLTPLLLAALIAACGPEIETVDISIEDHPDALTAEPGDNLFVLTLTDASRDFDLATISLNAGLPGETATVLNFTHEDANDDGLLNVGEKLIGREPPVNLFDESTVGKAVRVGFSEEREGIWYGIGNATWTPAN